MLVSGKNVAVEILKNNKKVNKIYLLDKFDDKKIINYIQKTTIPVIIKSKQEMLKVDNSNNQGIILDIPDYSFYSLDEIINGKNKFIVVLDHIEDPHNFGAIIRTCDAAGVDGIIIPKNRSVGITSTVMKTSAGALESVKICEVTNLNDTLSYLKKEGYWVVGTDMENSVEYTDIDLTVPIVLIIGSEGRGMSKLLVKNSDFIARIPMYGSVNSLNASVAAGIMIYEVVKQRNR